MEVTGKDTRIALASQVPYMRPEAMNGHLYPPALDRAELWMGRSWPSVFSHLRQRITVSRLGKWQGSGALGEDGSRTKTCSLVKGKRYRKAGSKS